MSQNDSQSAAALRIVLPQVAGMFQHQEARRLGCVCKEWQRLVALAPLVTAATDAQSGFLARFQQSELLDWSWTEEDPNAILAFDLGILFRKNFGDSEILADVLEYQVDESEEVCLFSLKLVVSPELFQSMVDPTREVDSLKEGMVVKLPKTNTDTYPGSEDKIKCGRTGSEESFEATIQHQTEAEIVLTLELTYLSPNLSELEFDEVVTLVGNKAQDAVIEKAQRRPVEEGVVWYDSALSESQVHNLKHAINQLADTSPVDYHPGSNGMVRDLVHPALYSYKHGETKVQPGVDVSQLFRPKFRSTNPNVKVEGLAEFDRFFRPYEASNFQWLPSNVSVSDDNTVSFHSEINGLRPRENYEDLYSNLASLLGSFIPKLEAVFHYARQVQFPATDDPYDEFQKEVNQLKRRKLSKLQVIPKIVDYELAPGESYEGVWHIEGMAHEHIVATCLYILERDSSIEGGEIQFKRAWTSFEAQLLMDEMGQHTDNLTRRRVQSEFVPLGSTSTPQGRMLVFPNTHVHKIQAMTNTGSTPCRRRIVVFFVVDPDVELVSTAQVPDQSKTISLEKAKEWRLELMNERKYYKQDWNLREISLCEH